MAEGARVRPQANGHKLSAGGTTRAPTGDPRADRLPAGDYPRALTRAPTGDPRAGDYPRAVTRAAAGCPRAVTRAPSPARPRSAATR